MKSDYIQVRRDLLDLDLPVTAKWIYICLADVRRNKLNFNGWFAMTLNDLCKLTKCSDKALRTGRELLAEKGLIEMHRDGTGRVTSYRVREKE